MNTGFQNQKGRFLILTSIIRERKKKKRKRKRKREKDTSRNYKLFFFMP